MINREQAVTIIKKYLKEVDNIRFAVAVEAILRKIAEMLERDEELWAITGLLHNLDYEYCAINPEQRGTLTAQLLDGLMPDPVVNAIKSNNYMHSDYIPTTSLDKSLISAVASVQLIKAVTKNSSSNKISDVELPELMVKFHDSSFAPMINRNRVALCEDVGIKVDTFLKISLKTMKEISDTIGL